MEGFIGSRKMAIGRIQGYQNTSNFQGENRGYTPHFTCNPNIKPQIVEQLPNKKIIKFMEKMKWLKGEVGGILITALGTGAVAPVFIAYNPFVKAPEGASEEKKKDVENTKKYTAMRQPVSAVLAILFQMSVLKPIDKGLDIIFNNPKYAKNLWLPLDQSAMNKSSYIEKDVRKAMKKENLKFANKEDFEKELAKRIKTREREQISRVAAKLKESGQIHIGKRIVDNQTTADVLNTQIDSYIYDANKLKIDDNGLKFYKNRATILVNNEKEIKDILKNIPQDEKQIKNYLVENLNNTKNSDIKTILQEIIDCPDNLRASRCERTIERINCIKRLCDNKFTPEKYLNIMKEDNAVLDTLAEKLKKAKITDLNNVSESTIQQTIENVSELCTYNSKDKHLSKIFNNTDTFLPNKNELVNKIYTDVTQGYKKVIEGKYKGFNQIAKIAIGLCVTLPITCTALNWVYPRFMELCFPKLAGVKKEQSEHKNGGKD